MTSAAKVDPNPKVVQKINKSKIVQFKRKNPLNLAELLKPRETPAVLQRAYMSTQDADGSRKLKVIKIKKGTGANLNKSAITSPLLNVSTGGVGAGEVK